MSRSQERMRELMAEQALEWFLAHRSGALSEARRQEFIDWLRASPAHAREYLALTGFVNDFAEAAKGVEASADALVAEACSDPDSVRALFPDADPAPVPPQRARPRTLATLGALAAAFVTILVLGAWWLHDRTTYATAHAEQRSWRMPDGSTVHLNSSSKLKIKFDGEQREVELLRGQALFQVAKDPRRPFRVHAGEAIVQAVGTEFDVYRQPRRTLISVVEGHVAVWRLPEDPANLMSRVIEPNADMRSEPLATLAAGDQARISRGSAVISKRPASVRKTVAWLQRQVIFDHDPLGNAVEEFNRYSELHIRIDDAAIRAVEISGIFSAYDAEAFVRFLERQPEMRVERAGSEIVVSAAPPAVPVP